MKESKINSLLPCPFCGRNVKISADQIGNETDYYFIGCIKCNIYTFPDKKDAVIKLWNTRYEKMAIR